MTIGVHLVTRSSISNFVLTSSVSFSRVLRVLKEKLNCLHWPERACLRVKTTQDTFTHACKQKHEHHLHLCVAGDVDYDRSATSARQRSCTKHT
jgi:hypothetical protein